MKETKKESIDEQKLQNIICSIQGLNLKILKSIKELIFLLDASTLEVLFVNNSVENLSGFSQTEILGKNKYETLSKDFLETYTISTNNFIAAKEDFFVSEEYIRTKNNELKQLSIKKYKVKTTDSNITYILEIASDITDNKKNIYNALSSKSLFFKLLNSSSIASAIINLSNHKIIDVNQAFINTFKYEETELKNKDFLEFGFFGKNIDEFKQNIEKISKAQNEQQNEFILTSKNGEKISCFVSVEQFVGEDGLPLLVFTAQSVNEIKGNKQKKSDKEKDSANSLFRSRFISMLSHEFRTPLTTIMLSNEMLKNYGAEWNEDERLKYFKKISDTVLHLNQLIEKLLTVGSIESGQFEFQPESIDIPSFFQSIIENISFTMKSKHQIKFKYSGNYNDTLIDENLISLIVTNLISNAIKYSQSGTEILFDSYCDGINLTIQIKDRGIGIPPEELKCLFQTFFRASNVGKSSGYGLGLAIVKKCVDAHSGEIFVESELNSGTTFIVTVPVRHRKNC